MSKLQSNIYVDNQKSKYTLLPYNFAFYEQHLLILKWQKLMKTSQIYIYIM